MQAEDVRALRRSAVPTAIAGVACVVIGAIVDSGKGALGALLALAVVTVFFGISRYVVARAAKVSPQSMMIAALAGYLVKILALAVLVANLRDSTAFNGRVFGFCAIALVLCWSGTQVREMSRNKVLQVEPRP